MLNTSRLFPNHASSTLGISDAYKVRLIKVLLQLLLLLSVTPKSTIAPIFCLIFQLLELTVFNLFSIICCPCRHSYSKISSLSSLSLTPIFEGRGKVTGKSISDFLITFHCNFVDILHGFFTNRRDALEISVSLLALLIYPRKLGDLRVTHKSQS
jgi:hypothetical protein